MTSHCGWAYQETRSTVGTHSPPPPAQTGEITELKGQHREIF